MHAHATLVSGPVTVTIAGKYSTRLAAGAEDERNDFAGSGESNPTIS